jgi:uncharacterized DUF497 family protein
VVVVERLVWDDWNVRHVRERHGLQPEVVEAVCRGNYITLTSYKERIVVIGPELGGRILTVVIGPVPEQPGVYYTFSARPASRKERRLYFQQKGRTE